MNLLWNGPVFNPSGYSAAARGYLKALYDEGINIQLQEKDSWSPIRFIFTKKDREIFVEMQKNKIRDPNIPRIWHQIPGSFPIRRGKTEIQLTVFELTRIPPAWVPRCNRMTETWVPNPFNVKVFGESGVKNLQVAPHGVDTNFFTPHGETLGIKNKADFNFLSVFHWNWRKGFTYLFKAFFEEFSGGEDVALIIKTYHHNMSKEQQNGVKRAILREKMYYKRKNNAKIILAGQNLSDPQMAKLYREADCFVLPSCAEGWGLPYSEAMSSQLPTIGTRHSGQLYFMNNRNSFLINIKGLERVHDYSYQWYHHNMQWAIPDVNHLKKLMRYVYEHPKEARKRALQARKDMIDNWTWKHAAKKIIRGLERLSSK